MDNKSLTPKAIVKELDKYIIGQHMAKKAVAVALRNRHRRSLLEDNLKDEIVPKNILMIGPTGVGKTEIARRLAKLVQAPFAKVEATKFTEVGYVGRDVESMVRDLVETSIRMVKNLKTEEVKEQALELANERIVHILVPSTQKKKNMKNPLEMIFGNQEQNEEPEEEEVKLNKAEKRKQMKEKLQQGELEDTVIEIEVEDHSPSMLEMFSGQGNEQVGLNMQELLGNMMPKKMKKRKLSIADARKALTQEEAHKLIDMDEVMQEAVHLAEQHGIIFIDEIDKIARADRGGSPDVSREGVQRDILPIVEGSTVMTKYGPIKTDYILFIAAGAFHFSKPSDLIPEMQGRFPIRVELDNLGKNDFIAILKEPKNALTKQYTALLETEGFKVEFSEESIEEIAAMAVDVNQNMDNIGARRLHTILEKLLEDLSYEAPEITLDVFTITPEYVREKLETIAKNKDLSQYIL
ncbi:ATP-dependent protease ATPase subunit HslU [Longirhabdus pacifica]|uniref:ATP-dependent protease ATPase subunit HslU n=1 Tax=Longirhabdus pacifica TaxID=2305227 RepID=UPI001008ED5E|nr:ATP-dependent protease ATPase subunit HslU [Longirhabdus pacifica]